MKTQIYSLVNGSSHIVGQVQTSGTNSKIRKEIAEKVRAENPEMMAIKVKGIELLGKASYSVSRLSISWIFSLTIDEYKTIAETSFGISPREGKNHPCLKISGDCEVSVHCGNSWRYIPESWIEILY